MNNQYYEAKLQIRPKNDEVLKFVLKQVENNKKNIFISKIVELKTGHDIYLSCRKFAISLGKQMKKKFHYKVKLSRTLFSRSHLTSKAIYRVTVLIKVSDDVKFD